MPAWQLLVAFVASSYLHAASGYGTMTATMPLTGKYAQCNFKPPGNPSCSTPCCLIDGDCAEYTCKVFGYGVNQLEDCDNTTCPQYTCGLFHKECYSEAGEHCFGLVNCNSSKGPCDLENNLCLINAGASDFIVCPSDCQTDKDCPAGNICVLNNYFNGHQVRYCQAMCPNVTIPNSVQGSISTFYPWTVNVTCEPGFNGGGEAVCLPSGQWQMPLPNCTSGTGGIAGGPGCADASTPQGGCCNFPLTQTFTGPGSAELLDICLPLANDTYCSFPNLTHNELWVQVNVPAAAASPSGWWWVGAKACGAQCHACQTLPCNTTCECEAVVSIFEDCASWHHTRPECGGIVTQLPNITLGLSVLPTAGATSSGGCCFNVIISVAPWTTCSPPHPCCSA